MLETQPCMDFWKDLRIDLTAFRLTPVFFRIVLEKLKTGKCSPDGVTAEILSSASGES